MQQIRIPSRAALASLIIGSAVASILWSSRAEAACVATGATEVTCDPPEDVLRDAVPGTTDWILQNGTLATPLEVLSGLELLNGGPDANLTLSITGVTQIGSTGPVANLVNVFNQAGLNTVEIANGTLLEADDTAVNGAPWSMVANVSTFSGTAGTSLTRFGGTIDFDGSLPEIVGVVTFVDGSASLADVELLSTASVTLVGGTGTAGVVALGVPSGSTARVTTAAGSLIDVTAPGGYGVNVQGNAGAVLNAAGTLLVTGVDDAGGGELPAYGYYVSSDNGPATANVGGTLTLDSGDAENGQTFGASVASSGAGSAATLNVSGDVVVDAPGVVALRAQHLGAGDAVVNVQASAEVRVTGFDGAAIQALSAGGDASVTVAGLVIADGDNRATVLAQAANGSVTLDSSLGSILRNGGGAAAVEVDAGTGFDVSTGIITTIGDDAIGVRLGTLGGAANYDGTAGTISTQGANAFGVQYDIVDALASTVLTGTVQTTGAGATGVDLRRATGGALAVDTRGGTISTTGAGASGLSLAAVDVEASVDLGGITANGEDAVAAFVKSDQRAVSVTIASGATVSGGWDAGAGLTIGAGAASTSTLTNAGTLSALSDRAFTATADSGAISASNAANGRITGWWALTGLADTVANAGGVDLRHLSDTNGDGTRDTKRVATVDFGAGTDLFRNEATGTVRLVNAGAATAVSDRRYLPDLMPIDSHAMTSAGVEQAHFVGLERFEHRGTITLRDQDAGGATPVAGDVLLLTSGTVDAAGVLTPGATPLVFLSDGGNLALDVVLNEGGASSHADMLVVDSVQLGPNGPTRVFVTNAGGLGAATSGAGIKIVDVLGGGTLSAESAFTMPGGIAAGAFTYNLFRSAPNGADGDWYLRTAPPVNPPGPPPVPGPGPNPPPPPPPPGPPVTYRPEAALFAALPGFLRGIDAAVPGSRQQRLGDEAGGSGVVRRGRAWARYVREDLDTTQVGTVNPGVSGEASGVQLGVELVGGEDEAGAQIGFYAGRIQGEGLVSGYSNGVAGAPVGILDADATFAGFYVSRNRGRGLYFDAVLQYAMYGGEALTYADGQVADIKGRGGYASLELGYGIRPAARLVIEPQLQVITQPQRVHDVTIVNAGVRHDPANTLDGRAGVRVKGELGSGTWRFQPYVGASLWHGLDHRDRTHFTGNGVTQTTLVTESQLEALEFNAGFSLGMGSRMLAFAEYSRLDSRGDSQVSRESTAVSAGLRFAW